MTFRQEAASWLFPSSLTTATPPEISKPAPTTSKLTLPDSSGAPTVVTFLRHCGCPFAEKAFRSLQATAAANPHITCIAISHSSSEATDKWLASLPPSPSSSSTTSSPSLPRNLRVIVDDSRELYAAWGLGASSLLHVLNPWSLWNVYQLGKSEGIWNRPTESGTRWQTSGSWAVDGKGVVRWGGVAKSADDVPEFGEAVKALSAGGES